MSAGTASLKRAEDFTDFLNASPTPFHAVHTAKQRLEKAGFKQIKVRHTMKCLHELVANSRTTGTRSLELYPPARRQVLPHT